MTYAFHERLGYLTACPTNVGTGMRVSVMLHLPALVITRQIEKVFRSLQKISLAVRGLFGEGSQAMGDFYQISNQITLGRSEDELVQQVNDIVPVIIDYERQARQFLIKESQENLHDRVSRAYGILRTAQTISSEETMHLLSSVRMGVNLGLIPDLQIADINELFIHTQPAHLQKRTGNELGSADRNIERARYLRQYLNREDGASAKTGDAGGEELNLRINKKPAGNAIWIATNYHQSDWFDRFDFSFAASLPRQRVCRRPTAPEFPVPALLATPAKPTRRLGRPRRKATRHPDPRPACPSPRAPGVVTSSVPAVTIVPPP